MRTRRRIVIGNWKMNTSRSEAINLATAVRDAGRSTGLVETVVCPPSIWLEVVARTLAGSPIGVGAQDCWTTDFGAYTGQVSPAMVAELASYVILGHSEHRRDAAESDDLVAAKALAAHEHGLTTVVCVGEDLDVREAGDAIHWVTGQVRAVTSVVSHSQLSSMMFAYEPIWAIGSGRAAEGSDAQEMAAAIRAEVGKASSDAADSVRVLYGGSAKAENASQFVDQPDVDGLLVGGASLASESFIAILDACDR